MDQVCFSRLTTSNKKKGWAVEDVVGGMGGFQKRPIDNLNSLRNLRLKMNHFLLLIFHGKTVAKRRRRKERKRKDKAAYMRRLQ